MSKINEAKAFVTIAITIIAALLIGYIIDKTVTSNEAIEIKSPATLYHSSEIRIAEIRGRWPRSDYLAVNEWLDSANVHVVDIDFDRASCYITYINPNKEE